MEKYQIHDLYIPCTRECGSKSAPQEDFITRETYPSPKNESATEKFPFFVNLKLSRGPADAFLLPPKSAGVIFPADCRTVVLMNRATGEVAMAHASLSGLLEESKLCEDTSKHYPLGREVVEEESVVLEALRIILQKGGTPKDVHAYSFLGISPKGMKYPIDHPTFGDKNRRVLKYLRWLESDAGRVGSCVVDDCNINLRGIIYAQLSLAGVTEFFQDEIHTDFDSHWHSFRRNRTKERNMVLVAHH
ncbi:MAG: hypothetical protein WDZ88_04310 [Candidatus Paceibacterota bacterium]